MDNTPNMMGTALSRSADGSASKNTLLTIILILLILITGAMIFNFYGMRFQSEPSNIPKCVGSDDLNLRVGGAARSEKTRQSKESESSDRVARLLREKVGDYSDGSYHPEMQSEMIRRAQEDVRKRIREKVEAKAEAVERANGTAQGAVKKEQPVKEKKVENMEPVLKSDKPESGKTKLCIYHMRGCGHCHDIMDTKQSNGLTKFQELQKVFASKPEVEVLDFQHGRDPEASKFGAFPVIMLVKDTGTMEYNRERSVEGMSRFIIQNM
jgi:hypothetical protein